MSYRLVLFSLALALAACAGPRPRGDAPADLPEAFPHHTADQIQFHLVRTADTLRAFEARASLTLRSPEQNGTFGAELRSRRADSLYLTLSPGLGIEAARVLVTPDSFFLHDRIRNRLTYGALADAAGLLPAPLAGGDFFASLLGLVVPEPGVDWTVTPDTAHYVLTDREGRRTYVVDPARWRVVRYEERAPDGTLVETRTYSDFAQHGAVYLPRRAVFERPADDVLAAIYYRSLEVNPARLAFPARVGATAERVLVE